MKDEINQLHVDILGISKLKWTGIGYLQSEDHNVRSITQDMKNKEGIALIVRKDITSI